MNEENGHRLIRKAYQCFKCQLPERQLVHPDSFVLLKCSKCDGLLNEISESDYKYLKLKVKDNNKNKNKNKNNDRRLFYTDAKNNQPIRPSREYYEQFNPMQMSNDITSSENKKKRKKDETKEPNHSSFNNINNYQKKDNPKARFPNPNRSMNILQHSNNNNSSNHNNYDEQSRNDLNTPYENYPPRKNKRYQSIDNHRNQPERRGLYPTNQSYSNHNNRITNINNGDRNDNEYHYPLRSSNHIINNNNHNNNVSIGDNNDNSTFTTSIYNNFFNPDSMERREREHVQRHNERQQRNHSIDPRYGRFNISNNPTNLFFFQNPYGVSMRMIPMQMIELPNMMPTIIPQQHNHIIIQNQDFNGEDIYDPDFSSFGSFLNGLFIENFAQNFRSNLENLMFERFQELINGNLAQPERKKKKTKKEALNKLKKFPMSSKYCKKNKNGKIELPNCCICISDIQKKVETLLLPCGHMFHWQCSIKWLKENNTCPVCRFELPCEEESNQ